MRENICFLIPISRQFVSLVLLTSGQVQEWPGTKRTSQFRSLKTDINIQIYSYGITLMLLSWKMKCNSSKSFWNSPFYRHNGTSTMNKIAISFMTAISQIECNSKAGLKRAHRATPPPVKLVQIRFLLQDCILEGGGGGGGGGIKIDNIVIKIVFELYHVWNI